MAQWGEKNKTGKLNGELTLYPGRSHSAHFTCIWLESWICNTSKRGKREPASLLSYRAICCLQLKTLVVISSGPHGISGICLYCSRDATNAFSISDPQHLPVHVWDIFRKAQIFYPLSLIHNRTLCICLFKHLKRCLIIRNEVKSS